MSKKETVSRRDSLKYMALASISAGLVAGCDTKEVEHVHPPADEVGEGFSKLTEEDLALLKQKFFTDQERETVRILANLILPADSRSGNAEQAGVVPFIEFMMLDQPKHQTQMRGGLKWLDNQCLKRHNNEFVNCISNQQTSLLDEIAYPDIAKPAMSQGVSFFNNFRDFVATGFWTSKMGIEDLEYKGNMAANWQGAPQEWLDRLGVSYDS